MPRIDGRFVAMVCFVATSMVGVGCLLSAFMLDEVLRVPLVDAALTPAELQDKPTVELATRLLRRMENGIERAWFVAGGGLLFISGVGLWSLWIDRHSGPVDVRSPSEDGQAAVSAVNEPSFPAGLKFAIAALLVALVASVALLVPPLLKQDWPRFAIELAAAAGVVVTILLLTYAGRRHVW